ncbi:hypothetical protein DFJ74DRAFT_696369 [Hyaloraphidium curvatum]|nr:hypothetical protein DFJ74DRAFT_696369 [Hyaloraphidium curvatum]
MRPDANKQSPPPRPGTMSAEDVEPFQEERLGTAIDFNTAPPVVFRLASTADKCRKRDCRDKRMRLNEPVAAVVCEVTPKEPATKYKEYRSFHIGCLPPHAIEAAFSKLPPLLEHFAQVPGFLDFDAGQRAYAVGRCYLAWESLGAEAPAHGTAGGSADESEEEDVEPVEPLEEAEEADQRLRGLLPEDIDDEWFANHPEFDLVDEESEQPGIGDQQLQQEERGAADRELAGPKEAAKKEDDAGTAGRRDHVRWFR